MSNLLQTPIPHKPMTARSCPSSSCAHDRRGWGRNRFLKWFSVAAVLFTSGHALYAQGAADALFIDEKGNLTIGTTSFIYQSGNVGIGTTTPHAPLAVMQNVNGLLTGLQFSGQHTPNDTAGGVINAYDADGTTVRHLTLQSNGGNVGIGTTGPGEALQIGSIQQNKDVYLKIATAGGSKYRAGIKLEAFVDNFGYTIEHDDRLQPRHGLKFTRNYLKNDTLTSSTDLFLDFDNGNVGIGTTEPKDKLDVAGNLRVLTGANPILFTSKWSGFPDGAGIINQAEIANDTKDYKTLMIVGNKSGGGTTRRVGIWDQLQVNGDVFVTGRLVYKWGNDWKQVYQERDGWAGSRGTSSGPTTLSDLRLKTNMQSLSTALDKVRHLRGVSYKWNNEALKYFTRDIETTLSAGPNATAADNQKLWQIERNKRYKELDTPQVGVVAQDVETVLPEAVTTDKAGYKSVHYNYLIPLLIEALKEQEQTVAAQAKMVARQQMEIERLTLANQSAQQQLSELGAVKAQVAHLENVMQHFASTQASGSPATLKNAFLDLGELIATGKKQ